ncbi:MAG TPA: tail fiber protein [Capsulimonadaceae bacterium]|jgi:microcystin-dependent protein
MSSPFLGEIRMVGFNFAPHGWAACSGQILPISQNTALFSLLGTQYGGNGTSNFALPNLNDATPIGQGSGPGMTPRTIGETGGTEAVTLTLATMPQHTHAVQATSRQATTYQPAGNLPAVSSRPIYASGAAVAMNPASLSSTGGSSPHTNLQPYAVVNFVIALTGIFPARS